MASFPLQLSLLPLYPKSKAIATAAVAARPEFRLLRCSAAVAAWLAPVSPLIPVTAAADFDHVVPPVSAVAVDAAVALDLTIRSAVPLGEEEEGRWWARAFTFGVVPPPLPSAEELAGRMVSADGHGPLLVVQSEVTLPVATTPEDNGVLLGVALREYVLDLRAGLLTSLAFTPTHLRLAVDAVTAEAVWMGVAANDTSRVFMRWLGPAVPDGRAVESTFFFRRPATVDAPVTCILHHTSVSLLPAGVGSLGSSDGAPSPAPAKAWPPWPGGGAAAVASPPPPPPSSLHPPSLRTLTHPLLHRLAGRLIGTRTLVVRPGLASTPAGKGGVTAIYTCTPASEVTALRLRLAAATAFAPTDRRRGGKAPPPGKGRGAPAASIGRGSRGRGAGLSSTASAITAGTGTGTAAVPASAASAAPAEAVGATGTAVATTTATAAPAGTGATTKKDLTPRREGLPRKRRRLDLSTVEDERKRRRIERNREAATRANRRRQAAKAAARLGGGGRGGGGRGGGGSATGRSSPQIGKADAESGGARGGRDDIKRGGRGRYMDG
ncbi:hypothetical protein MMPV_004332 [Pyropia vietnamensis]